MAALRSLLAGAFRASSKILFILHFLGARDIGREYAVGFWKKARLVRRMSRNRRQVETLSSLVEHLEMASALLRVPPSIDGDVIECGCYKGGSSVNLSLVCALVGRRLFIADSFEGLPEPADYDQFHFAVHTGHTDWFVKGRFAVGLDEVKRNLARHGRPEVCELVAGYFQDTLQRLDRRWVMAFLDVNLVDSLKPCIQAIWPRLQDGCRLYVHEARSLFLVGLFFDSAWWKERLHEDAPGFVGSGTGLALEILRGSELGYAQRGASALRGWSGERPGPEVFARGALPGERCPPPR
jgi:hypothetical protein